MSKDEFDMAMKLRHGRSIVQGDIITIVNEHSSYKKLFTTFISNMYYNFVPVGDRNTYMITITFDDLLTQFYSFGL